MSKGLRVFNLARFIYIKGLKAENDISLKIYYYLKEKYGVQSIFVKSVIKIPAWAAFLKSSLQRARNIYSNEEYIDDKYGIPVKFYGERYFLVSKIKINDIFKIPLQYFLNKNSIEKYFSKFEPNLIHAHGIYPDGYYAYMLSEKYNVPYVITLRGTYNKNYQSTIYNRILKNAAGISTPSATLYSKIRKNYSVELLPHPLEEFWFDGEIKKKKFYSINLITVSRLLEMKNIDVVLRAVKILNDKGIHTTYAIIGDGPYKIKLEELVNELGIERFVSFEGYRTFGEIKEIFANSNVFVMLSRPETYGRVYFEAASQGLVVIGARETGADGHFTKSEGIFINENVSELVHVLENTESNKFEELSVNAQKLMGNFRENVVVSRYHDLLSKALD